MFVCCECCVLSGRGLCDKLVTRLEESYRMCCVVVCDLETSSMRRPWPALGCRATEKKHINYILVRIYFSITLIILYKYNLIYWLFELQNFRVFSTKLFRRCPVVLLWTAWRMLFCEWLADTESSCWRNDRVATDSGWGSQLLKAEKLLQNVTQDFKVKQAVFWTGWWIFESLWQSEVGGAWTIQELIASEEEGISRTCAL